jgi:hypothetical protein
VIRAFHNIDVLLCAKRLLLVEAPACAGSVAEARQGYFYEVKNSRPNLITGANPTPTGGGMTVRIANAAKARDSLWGVKAGVARPD